MHGFVDSPSIEWITGHRHRDHYHYRSVERYAAAVRKRCTTNHELSPNPSPVHIAEYCCALELVPVAARPAPPRRTGSYVRSLALSGIDHDLLRWREFGRRRRNCCDWHPSRNIYDHGICERYGWFDHAEPQCEAYFGCSVTDRSLDGLVVDSWSWMLGRGSET